MVSGESPNLDELLTDINSQLSDEAALDQTVILVHEKQREILDFLKNQVDAQLDDDALWNTSGDDLLLDSPTLTEVSDHDREVFCLSRFIAADLVDMEDREEGLLFEPQEDYSRTLDTIYASERLDYASKTSLVAAVNEFFPGAEKLSYSYDATRIEHLQRIELQGQADLIKINALTEGLVAPYLQDVFKNGPAHDDLSTFLWLLSREVSASYLFGPSAIDPSSRTEEIGMRIGLSKDLIKEARDTAKELLIYTFGPPKN